MGGHNNAFMSYNKVPTPSQLDMSRLVYKLLGLGLYNVGSHDCAIEGLRRP